MDANLWKRAERIFLDCVDQAEPQRSLCINEECGEEAQLRELVQQLLAGDARQGSIRNVIGAAAGSIAASQTDRWIDKRIGAYVVRSRVGEGGMGVVYRAERVDGQFEQQVAIKVLARTLTGDEARQRFARERQFLANLNHPNICKLLDGGQAGDGQPYLVMELIDGTPVDRYCVDKGLSVYECIALFLQICQAVHYAHSNLIIHRDLKPSNILVTHDGVPKLLDFGIAKLIDPADNDPAMTMHGARLLTPKHASPEQVLGATVTTASDVYSLGVMLYELLTGQLPYEIQATASAGKVEQIITTEDPPLPSSKVTGSRSKTLRGDLDTIVLKALRKRPEMRYPAALELAEDLQRYLDHRPIVARRPTMFYLLSRFGRRHRAATLGICATLIAIFAGSIAATAGFLKAREAERVAIEEAHNAQEISAFLASLFEEANPDVSVGRERSAREILDIGRQRVQSELGDAPLVQAKVLETLSSVYKSLADFDTAKALLGQSLQLVRLHAPEDLTTRARLLNDLGDIERNQSHRDEALDLVEESMTLYQALGNPLTGDRADAVNNLALTYQELGRAEDAGPLFEEALSMRESLYESPHEKIALSLHNLGWHYGRTPQLDLAIAYTQRAIAMRTELFGEIHPRVAASMSMLSRFYQHAGRWEEAEATARKSVAIAEQIFEDGHPDLTFPMYELAAVLNEKGKTGEARDILQQVVTWERVSLGPDNHDLGMSLKAYGETLLNLAEFDEAENILREAQDIFLRLQSSPRSLDATETLLGLVYLRSGRLHEAASILGSGDGTGPGDTDEGGMADRQRAIDELRRAEDRADAARALPAQAPVQP